MSFILNQPRLRIKTSEFTADIIKDDMLTFGCMGKDTFINTVIENIKDDAEASISIAVEKEKSRLKDTLKAIYSDRKEQIMDCLIFDYENRLKGRHCKPDKDVSYVSLRINLNSRLFEYFNNDIHCKENNYYSKCGKYISALLEEYAHKNYSERELIYCKDVLRTILKPSTSSNVIDRSYKTEIIRKDQSGKPNTPFRPLYLMTDTLGMFYYLVGFSEDGGGTKPVSFRISRIKEINPIKTMPYSESERAADEKKYKEERRDVPFLSGESIDIKVLFNQQGIKDFKNIQNKRPIHCKGEESIGNDCIEKTFSCSDYQAKAYFKQFGGNAIITDPPELMKEFADFYEASAKSYKNLQKNKK